jgi:hypothetical protein
VDECQRALGGGGSVFVAGDAVRPQRHLIGSSSPSTHPQLTLNSPSTYPQLTLNSPSTTAITTKVLSKYLD